MNFLTTGQKIKEMRKILNMRQHELEEEGITRALISLIELDKRNVSKKTSRALVAKFSSKANRLGIEINIDEEYLMRNPREDAQIYCDQKLKNKFSYKELEVVLDISESYGLDSVKAEGLKLSGDLYFDDKKFDSAFISYLNSAEIYIKIQSISNLGYIYNRLGMCKLNMLMDLEALLYFNKSHYYSVLNNDLITHKKAVYNCGRCYKKLEKYDEAIQYIEEFLKLCDISKEFTNYAYAKILIANCYRRKNMFEKSIAIYEELIPLCNDANDSILGYIYNNLGDIYLELDDIKMSLKYFELAEKIRKVKDIPNLPYTYIEKARIFIKESNYSEALSLILKGLKQIKENPDAELEITAYYALAEVYFLSKDFINQKNAYNHLVELLKNKEKKQELVKVYSILAELYLNERDYKTCKKYLKMIQNI